MHLRIPTALLTLHSLPENLKESVVNFVSCSFRMSWRPVTDDSLEMVLIAKLSSLNINVTVTGYSLHGPDKQFGKNIQNWISFFFVSVH